MIGQLGWEKIDLNSSLKHLAAMLFSHFINHDSLIHFWEIFRHNLDQNNSNNKCECCSKIKVSE